MLLIIAVIEGHGVLESLAVCQKVLRSITTIVAKCFIVL